MLLELLTWLQVPGRLRLLATPQPCQGQAVRSQLQWLTLLAMVQLPSASKALVRHPLRATPTPTSDSMRDVSTAMSIQLTSRARPRCRTTQHQLVTSARVALPVTIQFATTQRGLTSSPGALF